MATLVAIGYPDETTAEAARKTVQGLEADLVIQADQVAAISRDQDGKYHVTTTHGAAPRVAARRGAASGGSCSGCSSSSRSRASPSERASAR